MTLIAHSMSCQFDTAKWILKIGILRRLQKIVYIIFQMLSTAIILKVKMKVKRNGPITRYVKLQFAHALGMPGMFFPPSTSRKPLVSDHGTCVTHVPGCMTGSLSRGGGENFPGILSVCATRNFRYLVRSPWDESLCYQLIWKTQDI